MTCPREAVARAWLAPARDAPGDLFAALADPRRRSILEALARGPLRPVALAEHCGIPRNLLTFHLRMLQRGGLVTWTNRQVRARPDGLAPLRRYLDVALRLAAAQPSDG